MTKAEFDQEIGKLVRHVVRQAVVRSAFVRAWFDLQSIKPERDRCPPPVAWER